MGGSLNEAERPEQSPATASQARPVALSVVIDGRLEVARARQMATLADRLGLAGIWLRYPWWPLPGTTMSEPEFVDLMAGLASAVQVPLGLLVDADAADLAGVDDAWLDRLVRVDGDGDAARPPAVFVPCAPGRNLAGEVAAAASAAAGRPVLAEVTVSVGRTAAEARARADADELFTLAGHPAEQGLFGTLEECQAAAARLAQAGATELVCYLPLAGDLPDVLAQVRSIAVGAGMLRPGEPPSAAPPPPAGWGGRRRTS
jgi:hypothetical protein